MISFLNPWYLLLMPIAAGPVVLHLLSRRKMKRTEFSSIFFLRKLRERRFRWLKLRDILLLILRTLFLVFLVLALSGPVWNARFRLAKTHTTTLLILDDSYSTAARFNDLKTTALRLVDELSAESRTALISPSGAVWDTTWSTPRDIRPRISEMTASSSGRDLAGAWLAALRIIEDDDARIAIVSDGQNHAMEFLLDARIPSNVELICFLDEREMPDNTAIVATGLIPRFALPEEEQSIAVSLAHQGEVKLNTVYLWADQQPTESKMISIGEQGKEAEFALPRGAERIKVEIDADSIPADNERYVLASGKKLRVALAGDSDSRFLELGLQVGAGIEVEEMSAAAATRISPSVYDLAIWDGTATSGVQPLASAAHGIPVLVLIGEEFTDYQATLTSSAPGFELMAVSGFFSDFAPGDLSDMRINQYVKVNVDAEDVLLRLRGGDPLLFTDSTRSVYYLTTRFTQQNTDIVYRALFPAMVQRIVNFVAGDRAGKERFAGDTLAMNVPTGNPLLVETPELSYEVTPRRSGAGYRVEFTATHVPGFYRIGAETYVVNPDPGESDLTRMETSDLERRGVSVYPLHKSIPAKLWLVVLILAALCLLGELVFIFL